jgi:hypothetical protein
VGLPPFFSLVRLSEDDSHSFAVLIEFSRAVTFEDPIARIRYSLLKKTLAVTPFFPNHGRLEEVVG